MPRISLLALTALAAAAAAVANGMSLAAPLDAQAGATRLGTAIGQDITARDAAAAKAQRTMGLREQAAAAAEARVQAELQAQQQAAAKPGASTGDEQYDELARIYQAMKPAAAAVVLEQLDMDVQMKVAQRMRERATALVLAQMTPKGAAALSMALARRKAPTVAPGAGPTASKSRSGK